MRQPSPPLPVYKKGRKSSRIGRVLLSSSPHHLPLALWTSCLLPHTLSVCLYPRASLSAGQSKSPLLNRNSARADCPSQLACSNPTTLYFLILAAHSASIHTHFLVINVNTHYVAIHSFHTSRLVPFFVRLPDKLSIYPALPVAPHTSYPLPWCSIPSRLMLWTRKFSVLPSFLQDTDICSPKLVHAVVFRSGWLKKGDSFSLLVFNSCILGLI